MVVCFIGASLVVRIVVVAPAPLTRTALVTGAGRGIGQAIADALQQAGMDVLRPSRADLDLSDTAAVEQFARDLQVDVLVNNAAENVPARIEDMPVADWQRIVDIALTAPFILTRGALPGMRQRRWGRIVNIASAFSVVSREGRAAYSSAKSGLLGLTRTAAIEGGPFNVLVNAVAPGYVRTALTEQNNPPERIAEICTTIPVGRLAEPYEVASLVAFLGGEGNTYITGQLISIDGGFLCQ